MSRRRRRILWTIQCCFDEFLNNLKRLFCCCFKYNNNNMDENEIPMNLISSITNNNFMVDHEEENGNDEEEEEMMEKIKNEIKTPFLTSMLQNVHSSQNNTSLTTCVQCGRVFPDFFHGIRVIYRQGPQYWTCKQCGNAARSIPTTPIIVVPRKSTA